MGGAIKNWVGIFLEKVQEIGDIVTNEMSTKRKIRLLSCFKRLKQVFINYTKSYLDFLPLFRVLWQELWPKGLWIWDW